MRGDGRIFKRGTIWWISYNHQGKELRESTKSTVQRDAEKLLRHRLQEIGADKLGLQTFIGPSQEKLTVKELLDHLEDDYKLRGKYAPSTKTHLERAKNAFGHHRATKLTANHIDKYIKDELENGLAPATINRSTQLLNQAYRLAMKRREVSNAPYIRRLPEKNARQGFFESEEIERVIKQLPHYLKDAVRFAYLSGWRRGEIFSLRWTDVDQKARVIRLRAEESKNGTGRTLALEGELWTIIQRRTTERVVTNDDAPPIISPLVFHHNGQPIVDFKKAWASACEKAKVGKRLFHDLRRTAIRNMVRAGVAESIAMKISGHKTRSVFDRYNIVDERDLRDAMKRTQEYLEETNNDGQSVTRTINTTSTKGE
jgi:integrase